MTIPVLGPDLIDLRTLEITAERTAMGKLDQQQEAMAKPVLLPAPVDEPEPPPAEAPAPSKAPNAIDKIRGRASTDAATEPAKAAKPAVKPAKKIKRAVARPSLRCLEAEGLRELVDRLNATLGAQTAQIVQAGILVPADRLVETALYLRDTNPIRYDYLASLQSVHYQDAIEVNYHLESTTRPGSLILLRVRTDEAEGVGHVPSLCSVWPGADFQEREVYDMMGVRFDGHPNLTRILMWEGFAYYPLRKDLSRTLLRRPDQGLRQPRRGQPRPALPRRGAEPPRHQPQDPGRLRGLEGSRIPTSTPRAPPRSPATVHLAPIDSDQFVLSMGPQHPSTHGVFRMNLRVDGETVVGLQARDGLHAPQP